MPVSALLQRLKTWFTRKAFDLGRRLRANFFLYLAAVFTLIVLADAATINYIGGMRQTSYDMMMRLRINVPPPSDDIVIIDIDEKTLAAMAPEYGRWPWPRQVLAEFVEHVEAQQPNAIVFDILFSDPDIQNPDSDAYFNEVMGAHANTLFPMLRLDAAFDSQSALSYAQVPGAMQFDPAIRDAARDHAKVALVVPPFAGVQQPGRLGTNNVYPDSDGVVRKYPVRLLRDGWTLPALPLTVAQREGKGGDAPNDILINWRGKPFTYHYASFSDVYLDMLKENSARPPNEFAGKILIIGSTAAGLHDVKGTPLDRQFPGVEILATAIDNVRTGDWIRSPEARWFYLLMSLAVIWSTAWAFYRSGAGAKVDKFYGLSAFALLGFSYATVNMGNLYINLSGAVFIGALYFSIARLYAFATARALDTSLVARLESRAGQLRGLLLALHFPVETREEAALDKLAVRIKKQMQYEMSIEILQGRQRGLWRLFENTLVVCWAHPADDESAWQAIRAEADGLISGLAGLTREAGVAAALPAEHVVIRRSEGRIRDQQSDDWRLLFAAAMLDQKTAGKTPPESGEKA